jgi:hypothetical protein
MMPPPRVARAYEWLLCVYPSPFRARFQDGMCESFERDLGAARRRGRLALVRFLTLTFVDVFRFGLAERFHGTTSNLSGEQRKGVTMKSLLTTDFRDGWRSLRATPIVTAVSVLSLSLGIGANTALFSILNSLVLKSLPVRDPARLAILERGDWTNPIWEALRAHEHEIGDGAFAWSASRFDLAESGETELVPGAWVSGRMFEVLGVPAIRGRTIVEADDARGGGPAGPVAMISHALWQRRFGGAEDVIGRSIQIERVPLTIVGVMPKDFFGPDVGRSVDVVIPIGAEPLIRGAESTLDHRSAWWLSIMFRLRAGETIEQAGARLRGLHNQIRTATVPTDWPADAQAHYLEEAFILTPAATACSSPGRWRGATRSACGWHSARHASGSRVSCSRRV